MKKFFTLFILSTFFYVKPMLAFQNLYYMGLQAGIYKMQDRSITHDVTTTHTHTISTDQRHKGITHDPNYGAVIGRLFIFDPWTVAAELRLTLSEFNHTRKLQLNSVNPSEFYTLKHVTRINNFYSLLLKPGYLLPSNAILYSNIGFGYVSTKIDSIQHLIFENSIEGAAFSQSQKSPVGILGVGLELLLLPNVALYYDFNFGYLKRLTLNGSQQIDNIYYQSFHQLDQFLFQAAFGLKWYSHYHFKPSTNRLLTGWYVGSGLGFMQANLSEQFSTTTSHQTPFTIDDRSATISPDLEVKMGRSFTWRNFILFTEIFSAYHPIKTIKNPKMDLHITPDETAFLSAYLKTGPMIGLTLKPGLHHLNHAFFASFGVGTTKLKLYPNQSCWPLLYLAGWGLETNLTPHLNLRAEYQFAYGSNIANPRSDVPTKMHRFVQQKGNINLIYYFA